MGDVGIAPSCLTLALDGDEWSILHPSDFTPGETAPSTHWIGGRVSLKASLDSVH
jgi:hypothetical protein